MVLFQLSKKVQKDIMKGMRLKICMLTSDWWQGKLKMIICQCFNCFIFFLFIYGFFMGYQNPRFKGVDKAKQFSFINFKTNHLADCFLD